MRHPLAPALALGLIVTGSPALLGAAAAAPATAPTPPARSTPVHAAAVAKTSALEARRVDRVKAKISWYTCYGTLKCAIVKLPLDYDQPNGETTDVALLKRPANKPAQKIGSLFVNPGGPGGSAVQMAAGADGFLSPKLLDRFDVIGMDPRGVFASDQVKCFPTTQAQTEALDGMSVEVPKKASEVKAYQASAAKLARACSTTGKPLTAHASTAEVARDMDVVRRGVGDKKLTYLGFSYGTYLGQVYANMFPDRVRALTIDGVLDARAWAGTKATKDVPVTLRIRSGDGAWRAMQEIFRRCDAAGTDLCPVAGNSQARFEKIAAQLTKGPITLTYDDGTTYQLTYSDFVGTMLSVLYYPFAGDIVASLMQEVEQLSSPATPAAKRAAASKGFRALRSQLHKATSPVRQSSTMPGRSTAAKASHSFDFPYNNSLESFSAVLCTDSINPTAQSAWPAQIARYSAAAPYFSEAWGWGSAQCAASRWTVTDADRYAGTFTKVTSATVLVVGDYWDPATNYDNAVATARLMGNARMLSSDSWGHTAYGTSACVTNAVDNYLLDGRTLPAAGTTCTGDSQPFQPVPADPGSDPTPTVTATSVTTGTSGLKPGIIPAPRPTLG